jgi:hypothetical protein
LPRHLVNDFIQLVLRKGKAQKTLLPDGSILIYLRLTPPLRCNSNPRTSILSLARSRKIPSSTK